MKNKKVEGDIEKKTYIGDFDIDDFDIEDIEEEEVEDEKRDNK